jgi:hypothetical protein
MLKSMKSKSVWAAALLMVFGSAWAPTQAQAQLGSLIVTMRSPASGSTVSGTVPVSASVSIVGLLTVAGVQFKLDGANLGAEDTSAPYAVSWNTTGAANGSHSLTAVARDALGIRYTSNTVTVTVANAPPPPPPDTAPPTVSVTFPASGATVSGTTSVTASAADNVGVAGVQFRIDGVNFGAEDTTAPYSVSWNTTGAANGSHTLTAVARDAAGNSRTSAPVTVTVANAPPPPPPDTTPPTVSVTFPASGATVSGTTSVTASASDNVGVVGVQFLLDGANLGAEDTSAPYSISWNTTGTANGSHTLTAVARDAAGNSRTSALVTVTVSNASPPPPPPPVDTTPPTVSITSPSNGATISATVTVTASAADNVGVVGVQFQLDGINGGAEATTAPYSVPWDTTTASNGSHILTAVARDAAGNRTPSAPVTVTVSNTTTPPPAQARRFEETDPSIAYTTGWRPDLHGSLSGGSAMASDTPGARATFTFTGPAVSWIGGRSFETGIARVSLDGSFVAEVDTFSKTVEVQVPLFTAVGLADTSHTLTIEVTGRKNPDGRLAFILVDAFDVPAATISRLQETDPSVSFTAGWVQGNAGRNLWSGGTAAGSMTPGDQATFTFTGTGVRWLGLRGPQNGGIARVFLDGTFMTEVDSFAPLDPVHNDQVQAELFKAKDLEDKSHTLTIEVTGRKNPVAEFAIVTVDAFDVTKSETRRQETNPAITYTGSWSMGNQDHPYSEGTAALSTTQGDQATFTFTGTSVSWIGFSGPQTGIARVILDGNVVADSLDTYAATEAPQKTVFTLPGLVAGNHTLTIQATGLKNPASTGASIVVDAFDVSP